MSGHPDISLPSVPREVIAALDAMRRPVVIAHVVPDADALGSMFAVAVCWSSDQCKPTVSLPAGVVSQRLAFMEELANVTVASNDDFAAADGFVLLDTAKQPRACVGPMRKSTDWISGRPVVNIDHHDTNTRFGTVNWVAPGAGSTCELVYALLSAADRRVDAAVATLLYAGIQTDTLGFSLPTTNASALLASAELVRRGADVTTVGEQLCRSLRQSEFDLLRVVYANTKVLADGDISYSSASYDEIHGAGCTAADIDDQISVPRSLHGARLSMLFSEGDRGKTRINFRGSGDVTVVGLAEKFDGGGHSQASGAVLNCSLEDSIAKVVPAAIEHLQTFPG